MSFSTAFSDIKVAIRALTWVTSIHETEQDPGGIYSVFVLANGYENTRELIGATTRDYSLLLRIEVAGKKADAVNVNAKLVELEEAVEAVSTLSGGSQVRPLLDGEWTPTETPVQGYMGFETTITLTIRE